MGPQWMILNVLHHQWAKTPTRVADNIGVDRSAVTWLLDRFEFIQHRRISCASHIQLNCVI